MQLPIMFLRLVMTCLAAFPILAKAQSPADSGNSSRTVTGPTSPTTGSTRVRRQQLSSATTSSTGSARIPLWVRHSRLALTRRVIPRLSGSKAPKVRNAIRVQLRHRGGKHYLALRASGSSQGRHFVSSLTFVAGK